MPTRAVTPPVIMSPIALLFFFFFFPNSLYDFNAIFDYDLYFLTLNIFPIFSNANFIFNLCLSRFSSNSFLVIFLTAMFQKVFLLRVEPFFLVLFFAVQLIFLLSSFFQHLLTQQFSLCSLLS